MNSSPAPESGKFVELPAREAVPTAHSISRSLFRARELAQVPSAISAPASSHAHEKMSENRTAQQTCGSDGDASMAAPGSWFRRLWKSEADDAVSVVPAPDSGTAAQDPVQVQPADLEARNIPAQGEAAAEAAPAAPAAGTQPAPDALAAPPAPEQLPAASMMVPDVLPAEAVSAQPAGEPAVITFETQPAELPASTENSSAGESLPSQLAPVDEQPVVSLDPGPVPSATRLRPARPLTYQQLIAQSARTVKFLSKAHDLSGAQERAGKDELPPKLQPGRSEGESRASNSPDAPRRFDSSASRRSVNPFDRPSLYRPPSLDSDKNLDPADLAGESSSSGGRWDPIPTLRPSGWRDSGSFRAAGARNPDDPWNWTSSDGPRDPWRESEPAQDGASGQAAGGDDSETPLSRQWGLLSRFQQSRGLGQPARRQSPADDSSAAHEIATTAPTQNRRKG